LPFFFNLRILGNSVQSKQLLKILQKVISPENDRDKTKAKKIHLQTGWDFRFNKGPDWV